MAVPAMSFVFNEFPSWSGSSNGGCSQFCSCQNLVLPQRSIGPRFSVLNLKGFQEECRVDPLVPNQILHRVGPCGILLFVSN